jgi:hypothetical protein
MQFVRSQASRTSTAFPRFESYRRINKPRPEERALARVSKDGHKRDRASGHPSRRRFAPPQDEVCGLSSIRRLDSWNRSTRPQDIELPSIGQRGSEAAREAAGCTAFPPSASCCCLSGHPCHRTRKIHVNKPQVPPGRPRSHVGYAWGIRHGLSVPNSASVSSLARRTFTDG